MRTTIAATGVTTHPTAGNVLPSVATAHFNFRYLPGAGLIYTPLPHAVSHSQDTLTLPQNGAVGENVMQSDRIRLGLIFGTEGFRIFTPSKLAWHST